MLEMKGVSAFNSDSDFAIIFDRTPFPTFIAQHRLSVQPPSLAYAPNCD